MQVVGHCRSVYGGWHECVGRKCLAKLEDLVVKSYDLVSAGVVQVNATLLEVQEEQLGHVAVHLRLGERVRLVQRHVPQSVIQPAVCVELLNWKLKI